MKFLRYSDLRAKGVPYSYVQLTRLEKAGRWPRRRRMGPRCVFWLESEVDAHIAAVIQGSA
jgi:prophage regulatory protein